MVTKDLKIDLVYLWVDGDDPSWLEKKSRFLNLPYDNSETHNKGRYQDNDELRYSLRSAHEYAPWIRKIFIVTDNQKPAWLNVDHPKIQVVDHQEIFPEGILPCYNSSVIEYFLHKIPGVSEHFLFANDDMFFNAPVEPSFFFAEDGYPILRLKPNRTPKFTYFLKSLRSKGVGQYAEMVHQSALRIEKKFGKFYSGTPHHNIDSYRKSDYKKAAEEVFSEEVLASQTHRVRTHGDLHRSAFSLYALSQGRAHLTYIDRYTSSRILIHKHDFNRFLNKYKPILFCLNDSQRNNEAHRNSIADLLTARFPNPSPFER